MSPAPSRRRVLFVLTEEDAQLMAQHHLGRNLTDEELDRVERGLEWGLTCWSEVMEVAIEEATREERAP